MVTDTCRVQARIYTEGTWAPWYNAQLLLELMPKGVVYSFLSFSTARVVIGLTCLPCPIA